MMLRRFRDAPSDQRFGASLSANCPPSFDARQLSRDTKADVVGAHKGWRKRSGGAAKIARAVAPRSSTGDAQIVGGADRATVGNGAAVLRCARPARVPDIRTPFGDIAMHVDEPPVIGG